MEWLVIVDDDEPTLHRYGFMALNNNLPYRQSIRLRHHDYRQPGVYFITICTHNREPIFGEIVNRRMHLNPAGEMVQSAWNEIPTHYPNVILDEFVAMPDHIHGILVITNPVGARVGALLAAPFNNNNTATPVNNNNTATPINNGDTTTPIDSKIKTTPINPQIQTTPANIRNVTGAASSAPTVGQIIRRFKSQSAIAINRYLGRSQQPLWQRNYWERIIRDDFGCQAVRRYIKNNPSRAKNKL